MNARNQNSSSFVRSIAIGMGLDERFLAVFALDQCHDLIVAARSRPTLHCGHLGDDGPHNKLFHHYLPLFQAKGGHDQ